jgi:hypothetical protein
MPSTDVAVDMHAAETETFRANEDLRAEGVDASATHHPAVGASKALCSSVANSPVVRTLLLVVVIGLLLYLIERLGNAGGSSEAKDALKEMLRNVLKGAQAAALPVLEQRNATTVTQ